MTRKDDISIPEGYFDELKRRLSSLPESRSAARPSAARRFTPYLSFAACMAVMAAGGNYFLSRTVSRDGSAQADKVEAQVQLSEEDIVDYLINTDTSLELLAFIENEQ